MNIQQIARIKARLMGMLRQTLHRSRSLAARAARPTTAEVVHRLFPELSVNVVDVGARWADSLASWYRVRPLGVVVGFEPDPEECARLNRIAAGRECYLPLALGAADGSGVLTITRQPACSSLLPPDPAVVNRFPTLAEARPVGTMQVALRRLDGVVAREGIGPVHVLKIDTQGSEHDVLSGSGDVLDDVLCVEVEVELNPIYQGQALFPDIDALLRPRGLVLWRLRNLQHYAERPRLPLVATSSASYDARRVRVAAGPGRLFWADAVYMRDPAHVRSADSLLRLAALFDALDDSDGVLQCLARLEAGAHLNASARRVLEDHARHVERG